MLFVMIITALVNQQRTAEYSIYLIFASHLYYKTAIMSWCRKTTGGQRAQQASSPPGEPWAPGLMIKHYTNLPALLCTSTVEM